MLKRILVGCLIPLCASVMIVGSAEAMATKSQGPTLLVVPAHYSQLQVAFDIANRYDTLLVSYQGDANTAEPLLHVWNGEKWLQISMTEYRNASFVRVQPDRVILIGDERVLPRSLVEASDWSPLVMDIPSSSTADIVNSFGKINRFRNSDWKWFAARYNLDIQDLNAGARRGSWYDRSSSSVKGEKWVRGGTPAIGVPERSAPTPPVETVKAPVSPVSAPAPDVSAHSSDIVLDDLPSVSEVQKSIDASLDKSAGVAADVGGTADLSGWREKAVAGDVPIK